MASVSVRYVVDDVMAAICVLLRPVGLSPGNAPSSYFRNVGSRQVAACPKCTKQSGRRRAGNAGRHEARTRGMEPIRHLKSPT
jgi:hypothetical protein